MKKFTIVCVNIFVPDKGWVDVENGTWLICFKDSYHIEKIDETDYWLHDLHPSKYKLRIRVRFTL